MRILAINESYRLAPFADVLFGCDGAWWVHHNGVPEFQGLKLTQDAMAATKFRDLHAVSLRRKIDAIVLEAGTTGDGGNSGFQGMNLAVQFGAAPIGLVGFDMRLDRGIHWHGRHAPGLNNPIEYNMPRWRAAFMRAAPQLALIGVRVFNCNPDSFLTAFPYLTLGAFLDDYENDRRPKRPRRQSRGSKSTSSRRSR